VADAPAQPGASTELAQAQAPSTVLQAALRRTTERLACELAAPRPAAPRWSELEWRTARAAAAIHGISSLLSARLRWEGPATWERFLCEQRSYTLERQDHLQHVLQVASVGLHEAGVAAVALKGAALHACGVYAGGERPMADLDLLVSEPDLERASQVVRDLGLAPLLCTWRERTFAGVSRAPRNVVGEHPGHAIKIELHTRICERLPWQITDISDHIRPTHPQPGLNAYPSLAALMAHLLLHAAGAMASRSLRMLHLHDLALLSARMRPSDWRELLDLRTEGHPHEEGPWWALPPLALAARYYPKVLPPHVRDALTRRCHRLLRLTCQRQLLSDVSHSRLWVDAFPGFEWSRSAGELVAYMRSRVRPDEETLLARSQTRRTADWAAYSPWCQLSQRQRMLRWLMLRRPTRPAAMHTLRAALAEP
jgi:hypothetical protein